MDTVVKYLTARCNWKLLLSACFEACGLWSAENVCFWLGRGGKIRVHHNMPSGSFDRKSPFTWYPRPSVLAPFGLCEERLLTLAKQWSPALDNPHNDLQHLTTRTMISSTWQPAQWSPALDSPHNDLQHLTARTMISSTWQPA